MKNKYLITEFNPSNTEERKLSIIDEKELFDIIQSKFEGSNRKFTVHQIGTFVLDLS